MKKEHLLLFLTGFMLILHGIQIVIFILIDGQARASNFKEWHDQVKQFNDDFRKEIE